jgi:gluconate 2-dehydrogenase alpha chain
MTSVRTMTPHVDLDPTYTDKFGKQLLRFTFDWKDNDIKMSRYVTDKMLNAARAMNPKSIHVSVKTIGEHLDLRNYQTTH